MARNTTTSTGGQGLSGTASSSDDSTYGSGGSGSSYGSGGASSLDSASSTVKNSASRIKEEAARQGSAALDGLKEGAQQLGSQAKERASGYVEGGVHAVTQHLDDFAQAIRAASDELSQKDQTMAAQIVRQAANGLESLSRSVSGTNVDDIVSSVRRFGRNNPAAFIGGAVLVGLALGRFARASGRSQEDDWRRDGSYGQGGSDERYSGGQAGGYQGGQYAGSSYGNAGSSRPYSGGGASAGGGSSYGSSQGGSSYGSSQGGSSYGSSQGGSSYGSSGSGSSPSQSQGYAGGGMGSSSTSGPSSETDESVTSSSSSGSGLGSSSISTGERS